MLIRKETPYRRHPEREPLLNLEVGHTAANKETLTPGDEHQGPISKYIYRDRLLALTCLYSQTHPFIDTPEAGFSSLFTCFSIVLYFTRLIALFQV